MTKNQLFRKIPPKELVEQIVKAFGLKSLDDETKFSKKKLKLINTVEIVNSFKSQLEKYYLPCKARTYLNGLTEKNVITVLRQCTRIYGYRIVSKEKYMKGEKYILYRLEEDCKTENGELYKDDKGSQINKKVEQIIINFD
tara:strand:- start:2332 stop:2754 length:423 start_codon:yes stop_codon:yes gene_type:complete